MEKIIFTDKLWQGFIGQAHSEKLLNVHAHDADDVEPILKRYRSSRYKKEALTLFLLYDKTIISNDHLSFSAPSLETENYITLHNESQVLQDIFKYSNWTDQRDPAAFARALEIVIENSDFVIPWATTQKFDIIDQIVKDFRLPKHEILTHFLDFAYQYFKAGSDPQNHIFAEIVGQEIADIFCEGFREAHEDYGVLHAIDAILFGLMTQAERFYNAKALSIEYMAPAAGKITSDGRYGLNTNTDPSNPSTLLSDFYVVRQVFEDANLSIPIPSSIKEALAMKSDANFKPFQEQLTLFQRKFAAGQIKESSEILFEIKKAKKYLRTSTEMTKGLRLVTYSSLPIAVIESLFLSGLPAISMTATVLSTAGQAFSDLAKRKNSWVLFGK